MIKFIVRSSFHPYVCPSFYLTICVTVLPSVRLLVHLSVHPSVRASVPLSVHKFVSLSFRLSIRVYVYQSVCPFIRPTVRPSIRLSVHLSSFSPFVRLLRSILLMKILLTNEYLFYTLSLSISLSVMLHSLWTFTFIKYS